MQNLMVNPEPPKHDRPGAHLADARRRLREAALEAETTTGRHETSLEDAERSLTVRLVRAVAGFAVVGLGIALLPLPGPGWVVVILGLSLLPFTWAERTIRLIRQRIPGVPTDGAIPPSTWLVMGSMVAAATAVSLLFGKQLGHWASNSWGEFWS